MGIIKPIQKNRIKAMNTHDLECLPLNRIEERIFTEK